MWSGWSGDAIGLIVQIPIPFNERPDWRRRLRAYLLDFDARLNSGIFRSGRMACEGLRAIPRLYGSFPRDRLAPLAGGGAGIKHPPDEAAAVNAMASG